MTLQYKEHLEPSEIQEYISGKKALTPVNIEEMRCDSSSVRPYLEVYRAARGTMKHHIGTKIADAIVGYEEFQFICRLEVCWTEWSSFDEELQEIIIDDDEALESLMEDLIQDSDYRPVHFPMTKFLLSISLPCRDKILKKVLNGDAFGNIGLPFPPLQDMFLEYLLYVGTPSADLWDKFCEALPSDFGSDPCYSDFQNDTFVVNGSRYKTVISKYIQESVCPSNTIWGHLRINEKAAIASSILVKEERIIQLLKTAKKSKLDISQCIYYDRSPEVERLIYIAQDDKALLCVIKNQLRQINRKFIIMLNNVTKQ